MEFPSLEWARALQEKSNQSESFRRASLWSDVKLVLALGAHRYWFKLYRGRIIDVLEYLPLSNPLGYDILVSGSLETWKSIASGRRLLWQCVLGGEILIDGNMLEANRMTEAVCVLADEVMREVPC